jgi:hypothetical protein
MAAARAIVGAVEAAGVFGPPRGGPNAAGPITLERAAAAAAAAADRDAAAAASALSEDLSGLAVA